MLKQLAFRIDLDTCIGCKTCQIACQDKNDLPADIAFRHVLQYGGGGWVVSGNNHYPVDMFLYYVSSSCQHCQEPACVKVCPTGAMHKDEQGIVSVDQDKCIGCRSCEYACPYRAPHFNAATGKMNKCDFCRDLLAGGKAPICVDACVTRSISYGILEELQKEYGFVNSIEPLPAAKLTHPSLVITPHRRTALSENAIGKVLNLSEEL